MKKLMLAICIAAGIAFTGCKGNGSTGGNANSGENVDSTALNDGTGAPGSGTRPGGGDPKSDTIRAPKDSSAAEGNVKPNGRSN